MTQSQLHEKIGVDPEVQARAADAALLAAKFETAHGIMLDVYGVGNVAAAADLLYDSVFNSDRVIADWNIPESEEFPGRNETLAAPLTTLRPGRIPTREEFTVAARNAVTRHIDHAASLYPGALGVVRTAVERGPTAIWTHGDMYGQDGREVFGVAQPARPGSGEQLKKLVGAGVGDVRLAVAGAAIEANEGPLDDSVLDYGAAMTVVASEDKFAPASIDRLVAYFETQGVCRLTVYEDRLENIQRLQEFLGERGIVVRGVWVRQGKHAAGEAKYDHSSIRSIDNIAAAAELIAQDASPGHGTVFDLDGVLSNQRRRVELQQEAIQDLSAAKGWAL